MFTEGFMAANKYSEKTYAKYENVVKPISRLIFREITVPEKVYMLETTKHLRIPPSKENMTEIVTGLLLLEERKKGA